MMRTLVSELPQAPFFLFLSPFHIVFILSVLASCFCFTFAHVHVPNVFFPSIGLCHITLFNVLKGKPTLLICRIKMCLVSASRICLKIKLKIALTSPLYEESNAAVF